MHARGQPSRQVYAMVTPSGRIAISRDTAGSALTIETGTITAEEVCAAASPMQLACQQKDTSDFLH